MADRSSVADHLTRWRGHLRRNGRWIPALLLALTGTLLVSAGLELFSLLAEARRERSRRSSEEEERKVESIEEEALAGAIPSPSDTTRSASPYQGVTRVNRPSRTSTARSVRGALGVLHHHPPPR